MITGLFLEELILLSDKMTRNLIIVITYAVALVLIVINFVPIMRAVWKFIVLFKPFLWELPLLLS